jgi:hypothetical protein
MTELDSPFPILQVFHIIRDDINIGRIFADEVGKDSANERGHAAEREVRG